MRIEEIRIKNFKCFEEKTFQLNERFTVFIGENASGKTSILDALAIAIGSFFVGIDDVKTRTIQQKEVRLMTIDGQPKPQKPVIISAKGTLPGMEENDTIEWSRDITESKTTHKGAKRIRDLATRMLAESRIQSGVVFPVIAYHGTGRLWAEHEKIGYQKQKEGIVAAYTNCLSAKSSSTAFLSWFKTQEDSINKFDQPLDKAHLQAFKNALIAIIPDERWQDMAYDHKLDELMGIFTDNSGRKHKLGYNQLSDGYRNLIGMAADIAYRCIQLNPHLAEQVVTDTPGIVLIDEIDLHLHPNWQRRIVQDLKNAFPKVQFVATTHSPFIVQSLDSDELNNLDRISDVQFNKLSINNVATAVMGTVSEFGTENHEQEELGQEYMQLLQEANGEQRLDDIEPNISDPAVRAFLKMQRLKKQHNSEL